MYVCTYKHLNLAFRHLSIFNCIHCIVYVVVPPSYHRVRKLRNSIRTHSIQSRGLNLSPNWISPFVANAKNHSLRAKIVRYDEVIFLIQKYLELVAICMQNKEPTLLEYKYIQLPFLKYLVVGQQPYWNFQFWEKDRYL